MKTLLIVILVLAMIFGFALLGGFIWMLGLGALSHIFNEPKLAIGFWPSVLVGFIVNALIGGAARSNKES